MDSKSVCVYAGLSVVVGTHLAMVVDSIPVLEKQTHAVVNLLAAGLILYGII
jgi:hypothetical protein